MATVLRERETLAFECHGTAVHVWSDDEEVRQHLLDRLPPGARPCNGSRPDVSYRMRRTGRDARGRANYALSVRCGSEREQHRLRGIPDASTIAAVVTDDVEFRVALLSPARLFVHAAAVAVDGRVAVVPGRSCAGKSTLAAALVRAGAVYLSDEFAVLDEAGLVHPFTRPLHLRAVGGEPPRDVRAAALGGIEASEPLPLGLVVSTAYRAGARWEPVPMGVGQSALTLFDNAVVARTRPAHALALIARALGRGATGVRSARGEAAEVVSWLLGRREPAPAARPAS